MARSIGVVLLLSFYFAACDEAVDSVMPEDRGWSDPESIAALDSSEADFTQLQKLVTDDSGRLFLLAIVPDEHEIFPPQGRQLVVLSYGGDSWDRVTEVLQLTPESTIGFGEAGEISLYWTGDAKEDQPDLPVERPIELNFVTRLFKCTLDGSKCTDVESVYATERSSNRIINPAIRLGGVKHLIYRHGPLLIHVKDSPGFTEARPILVAHGPGYTRMGPDSLFMSFSGFSIDQSNNFAVYKIAYDARLDRWSDPKAIFQDSTGSAQETGAIFDESTGELHVVAMLNLRTGGARLAHLYSRDGGEHWNIRHTVSESSSSTHGDPQLLLDRAGTLHLFWGIFGTPPRRFIYHNTYRNGLWGIEERLFPTRIISSQPHAAIDSNGTIHLVFRSEEGIVHSTLDPN